MQAYQSGEKLFSEYDQKMKDYTRKRGIVYTEIMLPANAPPEYADRQVLWNSAEEVEKQWNSQLARRFVLTFPREVPLEHYPQMVQEYCMEHFVSKGMCCDFAIHDPDPPGHNPHCHVMLTMRAMDEHGKWLLPRSRKCLCTLDENGERIRLPSGSWKSHAGKIPLTGMSSTMGKGMAAWLGRWCRTAILEWWEARSVWISSLL
ncbi:MAG: MobA/MobL family protein [Pilosibacter sp.]